MPILPVVLDYSTKVSHWPVYRNDEMGDCTIAAIAHMTQLESALSGGTRLLPTDAQVLRWYQSITAMENSGQGYDPVTGANDNGCIMLDVLNVWRKKAFDGNRIYAYAKVDTDDTQLVRAACYLFGGIYIGLALPVTAKAQLDAHQVWDVWADGNSRPNSWGGHAVNIVGYDDKGLSCITWGAVQRMTWAFWIKYCDEAYACLPAAWQMRNPHPAVNWSQINSLLGQLDA